jgi:hypothetical protein
MTLVTSVGCESIDVVTRMDANSCAFLDCLRRSVQTSSNIVLNRWVKAYAGADTIVTEHLPRIFLIPTGAAHNFYNYLAYDCIHGDAIGRVFAQVMWFGRHRYVPFRKWYAGLREYSLLVTIPTVPTEFGPEPVPHQDTCRYVAGKIFCEIKRYGLPQTDIIVIKAVPLSLRVVSVTVTQDAEELQSVAKLARSKLLSVVTSG